MVQFMVSKPTPKCAKYFINYKKKPVRVLSTMLHNIMCLHETSIVLYSRSNATEEANSLNCN